MRSIALILLSGLTVFAPAAQAVSCFCDNSVADEPDQEASCCCGDDASCCCESCPGHALADERGSQSLSGCVCTKAQPQSGPAQPEEIVPADDGIPAEALCRPAVSQRAIGTAPALEGDLRPAFFRPLLV